MKHVLTMKESTIKGGQKMAKAFVNGTECVIYDYISDENGYLYCDCYYPSLGCRLSVPATMIEARFI